MKTFQQFITEARSGSVVDTSGNYDKDVIGRSQITKTGEGGRIYPDRKSGAQTKRTKAVGGGKTAPAKTYKTRKDAGVSNPKRSPAGRQQQPTQERGSAALSAKEAQKKAYLERKAKQSAGKDKKKDLEKAATKLLSKKTTKTSDPNYKPQKSSGYSRDERRAIRRQGSKLVRHIQKGINKHPETYRPKGM